MTAVVHAPADLTVANAAEVRTALVGALSGAGPVAIDLSAVEDLDTAGLQLLLVARREAGSRGIELRCEDPSATVVATLELVGLAGSITHQEQP